MPPKRKIGGDYRFSNASDYNDYYNSQAYYAYAGPDTAPPSQSQVTAPAKPGFLQRIRNMFSGGKVKTNAKRQTSSAAKRQTASASAAKRQTASAAKRRV